MEFLRDALKGAKRLIKNVELRPVNVPRYNEFNASQLHIAAINDPELKTFIPDPVGTKLKPIGRRFLFNVGTLSANTSVGDQHCQAHLLLGGDTEGPR